jgi:hypothetical protein
VHREDFARVLLPRLDWELREGDVEQLDGAIAAGYQDLVLVRFGPRRVKERVLGVEPARQASVAACEDAVAIAHTTSRQRYRLA